MALASGVPSADRRARWIETAGAANERSRRLAAAAWLYHLGITLFSYVENRETYRRGVRPLAQLAARDAAFAAVGYFGPQRWRRAALVATAVTDVAAVWRLRGVLPRHVVASDRSISQLGLAWGLAAELDPFPGSEAVSKASPFASQMMMAAFWRMPRRGALRYLATETSFSKAVLDTAKQLRARVVESIEARGTEAEEAESLASRLAVLSANSSFFDEHVHVGRLPKLQGASWATEGHGVIDVLCRLEAERYRRFSLTDDSPLSSVIERLRVHRDIRGYETDVDDRYLAQASKRFSISTLAVLDALVEDQLVGHSTPIVISISDANVLEVVGADDARWSVELG